MAAEQPHPSILDERLAEIDRRLRSIQSGLEPGDEASERPAPPPAAPPAPAPAPALAGTPRPRPPLSPAPELPDLPEPNDPIEPAELVRQLHELIDTHHRLLSSTRELLASLAAASATTQASVRISAGPLASTEALHDFQRRLSELPGVYDVSLREFEGEDRAVLDVHLVAPRS